MAQASDVSINLEGEDEEFKEWFNQQLTQALTQENVKHSLALLSLRTYTPVSSPDINNEKIKEIILSEKAFDPKQEITQENIINFLREKTCELFNNEYDHESMRKISEKIKNKDYNDGDVRVEEVWTGLLKLIGDFTKWLTHFSQKISGFHVFDKDDLYHLVYDCSLLLLALDYSVFYDSKINECFIIFSNNVPYSRKNIKMLFGKNLADLLMLFFKKCSLLNMTEIEKTLFHPFALLSCDITLIKVKDYLNDLKSYYINTLINEFKSNNRDEIFSKNLMDFFKVILVLEMNKENYRCQPKKISENFN